MSLAVYSACLPVQVSGCAKSVLLAMADNSGDDGIHHGLSLPWLMQRTCWSESEARGALAELERAGVMVPYVGGPVPNSYRITMK